MDVQTRTRPVSNRRLKTRPTCRAVEALGQGVVVAVTGRLRDAFAADPYDELEAIHTLKELLRDIDQTATDSGDAAAAFDDWFTWVDTYDVPKGHRLAGTVRSWLAEVLAYFDTRLTNGRIEGKNLIIKQVKRQGFGYRNPNHYRTRVLYRCA